MPPSNGSRALHLYLVTIERPNLVDAVGRAITAGTTMVQLRLKERTDRDLIETGTQISALCRASNIPLIVNDRVDIAMAIGADGVHLGVDDLPVADARRIAGEAFIIGYSPETDDQIRDAAGQGATYLGIGPYFATDTKGDAGPPLGSTEFSRRRTLTGLPVVAIGGITAANAHAPLEDGADGIAVASAILGADDIGAATRRLVATIRQ